MAEKAGISARARVVNKAKGAGTRKEAREADEEGVVARVAC